MKKINLGILDIGVIGHNKTAYNNLNEIFDNVKQAEDCGYSRFWLGEHHGNLNAWRNPEILIALLAGYTERIKVGAAGILLNLSTPLRIAQSFKLLEAIYSQRIDLGVARGGMDTEIALALLDSHVVDFSVEAYGKKVEELIRFLNGSFDEDHPYKKIIVPPNKGDVPQIWTMGSSFTSIPVAVKNKTCFSYATYFVDDIKGPEIVSTFKDQYFNLYGENPTCNVAIAGVCAETDKKARKIIQRLNLKNFNTLLVGSPEKCHEILEELQEKYDVNEFIFRDVSDDNLVKMNSYALLSEGLSLNKLE